MNYFRLTVAIVAAAILSGCAGYSVVHPQPVYGPVVFPPPPQPPGAAARAEVPPPPVAYRPVCGYPGQWAWTGIQWVCVYRSGTVIYGPGYYWSGPVLIFRYHGGIWHHHDGRWHRR